MSTITLAQAKERYESGELARVDISLEATETGKHTITVFFNRVGVAPAVVVNASTLQTREYNSMDSVRRALQTIGFTSHTMTMYTAPHEAHA